MFLLFLCSSLYIPPSPNVPPSSYAPISLCSSLSLSLLLLCPSLSLSLPDVSCLSLFLCPSLSLSPHLPNVPPFPMPLSSCYSFLYSSFFLSLFFCLFLWPQTKMFYLSMFHQFYKYSAMSSRRMYPSTCWSFSRSVLPITVLRYTVLFPWPYFQ